MEEEESMAISKTLTLLSGLVLLADRRSRGVEVEKSTRLRRMKVSSVIGAVVVALIGLDARTARASTISFAPGDYDNTQNQVNAGPTPVNNQTTGSFRDIFWWGSATGVGDKDYIN